MISTEKSALTSTPAGALEQQAGDRATRITWGIETITPGIARQMLENVTTPARADKSAIAKYAEAMKAGGWVYNGLPVIVDETGGLLDGYQRLLACLEAQTPFRSIVARNVKADTLHTIDQHRRRTFADVLQLRGYRLSTDIQSALTKLIRIDAGDFKKSLAPIGWLRLDLVLAENPEILPACELSDSIGDALTHRKARAPFCFMALKAGHGEKLRSFLAEKQNRSLSPENPARMLGLNLESMIANRKMTQIDSDIMLGMLILAFNDYLAGKKAETVYSWMPDYGASKLTPTGRPLSLAKARDTAPRNCGLPTMTGYPGLGAGTALAGDGREEDGKRFAGGNTGALIAAAEDISDAEVQLCLVTPEMAARWLAKHNRSNRKIQDSHVAAITRDIKNGNWMVNAQPISFCGNPLAEAVDSDILLLNGQHRLMACAKSGVAIEIPIAVNVPSAAFATFDTHGKRNKFVLEGDPRVLRSALIFLWRRENGLALTGAARPTESEILEISGKHPRLKDFYIESRRMEGGETLEGIASAGVITYFLYHIHLDDPEMSQEFTDQMRTGLGVEKGNPIGKERSNLMRQRKSATKYSRKQVLEVLLHTWEEYKSWRRGNASQRKLL